MVNDPQAASSSFSWRSEEDYFLARLAVQLGLLDEAAIHDCLREQTEALQAGENLSLGQLFVRGQRVSRIDLIRLKQELMMLWRQCPHCGAGRYLAIAHQPREEPCLQCKGAIHVPAAGSSVTGSWMSRRQQAMRQTAGYGKIQHDPLAAPAHQQAGPQLFGNYVMEAELAKGGMGAVYRVRHAQTGTPYALKVLLAGKGASENQLHRFKREAKAQQELVHPNIVKIHDAGEWEGILYYTMDLVEGSDLGRAHAAMSLEERIAAMEKVARAMHHAHSHGYIHRDLKPANILIDKQGDPLVTDFGLAKNLDGDTKLTQDGAVMGTPYYMAPEQAAGKVDAMGPCTDIFALGALLYELVTGVVPFDGETAIQLYAKICNDRPASFAEHGVMEAGLEQIAYKALQKEPDLRYETAELMAEDLARHLRGDSPIAAHVSASRVLAKKVEKHKRSIGFMLGLVIVGLLVLLGGLLGIRELRDHLQEGREREAIESAAKLAISTLFQAQTDLENLPPREGTRVMDDALLSARRALDTHVETASLPELRERLSDALLRRAEGALRTGSGGEARLALTFLDEVGAKLEGEAALEALLVRVRAHWRLGDSQAGAEALKALKAEAADDPRVRLLDAIAARRMGAAELERALQLLQKPSESKATRFDAGLERARILLLLEREKEARKEFQRVLKSATQPARAYARWGEILLAMGRLEDAAAALRRAVEGDPGDLLSSRRFLSIAAALGRPLEAVETLRQAYKRRAGDLDLKLLWLRARSLAGEDVVEKISALDHIPEAGLLSADLAAVTSGSKSYEGLDVEGLPRLRATRARWRTREGVDDGGDVAALEAILADLPHDLPPDPGLARSARDAGWAYFAKGDTARALTAARGAARGLPGDVDTLALLARLEPSNTVAFREAFTTEVDSLQGALGRGLFASRAARTFGKKGAAPVAFRLLRARLAGDPSLSPLREELAWLATYAQLPPPAKGNPGLDADTLLDWQELLPPPPLPGSIKPEDRARARKLAEKCRLMARGKDQECADQLAKALEIDPTCELALWEYAERMVRITLPVEGHAVWNYYVRRVPTFAMRYVLEELHDWRIDASLNQRRFPSKDVASLLEGEKAKDPARHLHWILDRLFAALFPEDDVPKWTRADPKETIARIDWVVRRDPQFVALLYLRAQQLSLMDRGEEAKRDLALLDPLVRGSLNHDGVAVFDFWDQLYRVWILAPFDADEALTILSTIPTTTTIGERRMVRLIEFVKKDSRFASIREHAIFTGFLQQLQDKNY